MIKEGLQPLAKILEVLICLIALKKSCFNNSQYLLKRLKFIPSGPGDLDPEQHHTSSFISSMEIEASKNRQLKDLPLEGCGALLQQLEIDDDPRLCVAVKKEIVQLT
uniref:Uncharacterized protein n=1 Tax=Tanacetum cinerariifolium TaxID=118510 RepID=A0A6L2P5W3_TANCI|nr:hypothetical protein [Tanacetum cinerariifolium]